MGMLLLLSVLALQEPKADQKLDVEHTKLLVFDAVRGITFRIRDSGTVELSIRQGDPGGGNAETRTYSAPAAAEFLRKYPELVRKYDLGRHLGSPPGIPQEEFERWWGALKRMPAIPPSALDPVPDTDLGKRLEEELRQLDERLRILRGAGPGALPPDPPPQAAPVPGGPELGIKVQDVGETLREQLGLGANEGVLVVEVKPGSLAEKARIQIHDILVRIDGRTVTDRWQFRLDVRDALARPAFDLELLRGGKKQTVQVRTAPKKDE